MNDQVYSIATLGFRRCTCDNFKLTISKIAVKRKKDRYRDSFKNLCADVLLGIEYLKPIYKWEADCSQCSKLYWVSDTQKSMKQKIDESGFSVKKLIKTI